MFNKLHLAYKLRWRRRRLLFRAFRCRHQLRSVIDQTRQIKRDDILLFSTVRNEIVRLPYFLEHCRKIGVSRFLFVVNSSDDGTLEYLSKQPDVSVWTTDASYKASRYGVDWLTWLQRKYAHGHWCLTLDADELLIYPDWEKRDLKNLTQWLDQKGVDAFGASMLDLYPKGPIGATKYKVGTDPLKALQWFDCDNYTWERTPKYQHISIRGGARKRMFFKQNPEFAPDLNKTPLIKWHRSYAYVTSSHIALPRKLNTVFDARHNLPTGILLHTKFLDIVLEKSQNEKKRREHFLHPERYDEYYDNIISNPDFHHKAAKKYLNWQQLVEVGLMSKGSWPD